MKGSNRNNALLSAGTRRVAHIPFSLRKNSSSSTSVQPIKCSYGKVVSPIAHLVEDVANGLIPISQPDQVKRKDFPTDFVFGASTSALQTEGLGTEGGRGPSTWDSFLQDSKLDRRIEVILSHLYAVREAMKAGVNMKGYFVWALMDCMEMGSAYDVRFGLHYTDYKDNFKRYPKKSAKWFTSFLKN